MATLSSGTEPPSAISVVRTRSPASARVSHSGSACMGARVGRTVSAPWCWGLPARMLPKAFARISTSATVGIGRVTACGREPP